jgi:hypothetical protein
MMETDMSKLVNALLLSSALLLPSVAMATEYDGKDNEKSCEAKVNEFIKEYFGTPGDNKFNKDANDFAHKRNEIRKKICDYEPY